MVQAGHPSRTSHSEFPAATASFFTWKGLHHCYNCSFYASRNILLVHELKERKTYITVANFHCIETMISHSLTNLAATAHHCRRTTAGNHHCTTCQKHGNSSHPAKTEAAKTEAANLCCCLSTAIDWLLYSTGGGACYWGGGAVQPKSLLAPTLQLYLSRCIVGLGQERSTQQRV
jgi:hypothetical protein